MLGERESLRQVMREFDTAGALLLTVAISMLIFGLNLAGSVLPCKCSWSFHVVLQGSGTVGVGLKVRLTNHLVYVGSHPFVVIALMTSTAAFPAFLLAESVAVKPIMPLCFIMFKPRANLIISNFLGAVISNAILFNA